MSKYNRILAALVVALPLSIAAQSQDGPKNGIVLIIRHAENPENGRGLSPRGKERAKAYKNYFSNFTVDSKRLEPDVIFAANDSKHSHRPRLTVQPFAKSAKLQIDSRFTTDQSAELAAELRASNKESESSSAGITAKFRLCFARWEPHPKRYCQTVSGPV